MADNLVVAQPTLTDAEAVTVLQLLDHVTASGGVTPLSEQAVLRIRYPEELAHDSNVLHLLLRNGEDLDGYAQLSTTIQGATAEVAAANATTAGLLLDALVAEGPAGLKVWAHGERSLLAGVLTQRALPVLRVLLQLRRPLSGTGAPPLAEPVWPAGITVRTFVVGQDEAAWLAVNNAAFVDHPDQSNWTLDDVRDREAEAWFDPAGFFVAEEDGELVGFHWTKVHQQDDAGGAAAGSGPIGEVYVVGISPSMQGRRLGSALTLLGLRHLRDRGLATVMLYVDESNTSAVHVYERLGFSRWDADTCFRL